MGFAKKDGMKYARLGSSDLEVSRCCLGTMTWGEQNTEEEAWAQLDRAVELGINFIDTAEMYPVPPSASTVGRTEEYLGRWMQARGNRGDLVVATKVLGPGYPWVKANRTVPRGEEERASLMRDQIFAALEGSLRRLQTDYVDLYQIHWPERYAPAFGRSVFHRDRYAAGSATIEEQVQAMGELIRQGKVRHWGLSNETTYGLVTFCETARRLGVPLPVSVQNDFSLLNRNDETHLAEALFHYNVSLLTYGSLAGGTLSGKYHDGSAGPTCRHERFPSFQPRYHSERSRAATAKYVALARARDIAPVHLALAWADSRWFVGAVIIGATSVAQLDECAGAWRVELGQEVLDAVDEIHRDHRNPNLTD